MKRFFMSCIFVCLAGCMQTQVRDKATRMATTTSDLLYQQVLDNLAHTAVDPAALPYLDLPGAGTAQLQNSVQATYTPGWDLITSAGTYLGRYLFDKQTAALNGQHTCMESWQIVPQNNPDRLYLMQCAYRRVLGTEDPIGADVLNRYYLIKNNVAETGYSGGSGIKPEGSGIKPESPPDTPKKQSREPTDNELKLVAAAPPPGSGSPSVKPLPLNIPYDSFVKPGWFGVGRKKEVPRRGVCYVGHYCDTYVWVTRCNTQDLTDFTLAIVDIATPATIDVSGQIVRQNNPFAGLPPPPPAPPNVR